MRRRDMRCVTAAVECCRCVDTGRHMDLTFWVWEALLGHINCTTNVYLHKKLNLPLQARTWTAMEITNYDGELQENETLASSRARWW